VAAFRYPASWQTVVRRRIIMVKIQTATDQEFADAVRQHA
jgi:hypothetical protein